ncbi:MAG: polymerase alpha subunit [Myxococcales bacterium]|nr:polymerase alpha subunit [Myxococcales bacterium]
MAGYCDYVELRAASAFSFLRASSLPEDLADRAAELGYNAMALVDRDGVYGAPRFHGRARKHGLHAMVGSDLTLEDGGRLMVLVQNQGGYKNLCRVVTNAKAGRPKGETSVTLDDLERHASGLIAVSDGKSALDRLSGIFPGALYLEIGRHHDAEEERRNRATVALARQRQLPLVATNDVRYAKASGVDLCDVLACIREKTNLDDAGTLLSANAERHLKSAAEMRMLFRDLPDAVDNTLEIAARCGFTLEDLGYQFPIYPVPDGGSEMSYLTHLVHEGARRRYRPITPRVAAQIERELGLIAKLDLAGYFLIVWDIVDYCNRRGLLVQGRGSAANSSVCYALGITAVDPIGMELLFERFLSEERGEWPDIDLDLPSGDRREEVIQYVYKKYGARGCAMTANCITYRPRSAVREIGKVLGLTGTEIDRLSKRIGPYEFQARDDTLAEQLTGSGLSLDDGRVKQLLRLAGQMMGLPRHLGQHSGGMVMCAGRLDEVVPLEPASMPGRVVVQWDKDDCADMGIIKIDLLGLGMMAVLADAVPLVRAHEGIEIDLAHLPPDDPKTYAMIQKADTVGVFQIESRAQMATLPRMRPERFYDLVVEVAIIRPGPIVGQMVHPYLKRRAGREAVTYAHPSLRPILQRTLGVPLFQEQLMRVAMVAAGFSGGQAEELRRAMGSKRSQERMRALEAELRSGMAKNGIVGKAQDDIVLGIKSFALYGFPESHSASFALLVYASCYLKAHHPAAFYTALLNNWPMGFYHPATLITDARRRGVKLRPIDVTRSGWLCTIEEGAIRIGLRYAAGLRQACGEQLVRARDERAFASVADVARRSGASPAEMTTLASIGALNAVGDAKDDAAKDDAAKEGGLTRRRALWQTAALGRSGNELFGGVSDRREGMPLDDMTLKERLTADFQGTGMTTGPHPISLVRPLLTARGIVRAADLATLPDGTRVETAGTVVVRQRPGTAKGFFFITLEDETGFSNAIITPQRFATDRTVLTTAAALVIGGTLQNQDGVVSVKADHFAALREIGAAAPSHDFH